MLVGREVERRTLDGLVAGARLGRSGVLVLTGEAGIGKTTLLDYATAAATGITVVQVVGTEAERDLPFGALALALAPTPDDLDHIPAPQARALRIALALDTGLTVDRFAIGAATLSVLSRHAEANPVALVLDDAHHLDRPSAEAIVFAARRLLADSVLILAALRADQPSPLHTAGLPTMLVGGLDTQETSSLLLESPGTHTGPNSPIRGDRSTWVQRATGGNPLAIIELTRDPRALLAAGSRPGGPALPVPQALADSFISRATAVGPSATTLLALTEAAGGDLRVVLRAVAALSLDQSELVELETADLLRVTPDALAFVHPLVGSSAYARLSEFERRRLHAAIVDALDPQDAVRRAWHRAAAAFGPDEGVAGALESVAGDAVRRGAYAVAASALERAAELTDDALPRAGRSVSGAEAAWSAGDSGWALRLLAHHADLSAAPALRTRALTLRGEIAARTGSLEQAWTILVSAASEIAETDPERAIHLLAEAVDVAFYLGDSDVARETQRLATSLVERVEVPQAAGVGHLAIGMARTMDGRDGSTEIREGIRLLEESGVRPGGELDSSWLLFGALFLREDDASRRTVRSVKAARADTTMGALPHLLFHVARDDATTDRWADAESSYSEAAALARELGQSAEEAASLAGLAWLEARLGKEEQCRAHAHRALELAGPRHIRIAEIWADHALGDLELGAGRVGPAAAAYTHLADRLEEIGIGDVDLSPAPELVEVLLRSGEAATAHRVAERYAERATAKGAHWSLARAGRSAGLLAAENDMDRQFTAALEIHALTPDLFEKARTQLAYGSRLRRARRRVDARGPLEAALRCFEALGARPWAGMAADELEATGVAVARRGESGLELLTPRERQIVSLIADGATTRSAAGALFLSPKTVEYHLRHVYTKLDISSRGQLLELVAVSRS